MLEKICIKCKIRYVSRPFKDYDLPICWICYLKSKKMYKAAIREIKLGWFGWQTNLSELKLGWSFAKNLYFQNLFLSILKMKSLNKTPKTSATIEDFYSKWQIKTAKQYFGI